MITKEAKRLNQVIKDSEEYKNYQKTLEQVKQQDNLYQEMNVFRKRNYELQSYDDEVNRYQEIYDLRMEHETILNNPMVNEFLVAEQILMRKLTEVYEIIANDLELDYTYME